MKKVKVTQTAREDMRDIVTNLANMDLTAAVNVLNAIDEKIELLKHSPNIGFLPKDDILVNKGYKLLTAYNYLIFHVELVDCIEVRYVIHGSCDYAGLVK